MTRNEFFTKFRYGINVANALECYEPCDNYEHAKTKMTVERNVTDEDGNQHDFKIHIDYWDGTNKDFYNFEEIWHNPMLTKEYFAFLHSEGYDHVRLTLNMNHHYINAATQEIDPVWINHVRDIITMIIDAGLPVIITSQNDMKDLFVSSQSFISMIDENYVGKDNTERTLNLWKILAEEFNDFSNDDLMFDPISEIYFSDISWSDTETACTILKKLFQLIVSTIRSTGGNNATRLLHISAHLSQFELSRPFVDSFNDDFDENCILALTFYTPYQFTIAGMRHEWGSDDDLVEYNKSIEEIINAYKAGVPIYIHEYAAAVANYDNYLNNVHDACKWVYLTTRKFAESGIPMAYWDPGSLINRKTLEYKIPFFRSMINAALNGEDFDIDAAISENPFDFHEWWEKQ